MNARHHRLVLAWLLSAGSLAAIGAGTAIAAGTGNHADIGRILFRLKANVVICGTGSDSKSLVCFRPDNGATVRLARRGAPNAKIVAANRGVPARARSAPLLRKGHVYRTSVYRCSLKKTDVRCTNGVRHGFQIGKDAIFRF
jgi:antitoxin (DNA-binding transcriptional repressor) of toxin-antitoxin stability system